MSAPLLQRATVAVFGNDLLARSIDVPSTTAPDDRRYDFILAWTNEHLELRDQRHPKLKPLYVDLSGLAESPYALGLSRRQPLARAIGKARNVVDATAGLAQDAMRIALLGYRVTAIERNGVIAALVKDGL